MMVGCHSHHLGNPILLSFLSCFSTLYYHQIHNFTLTQVTLWTLSDWEILHAQRSWHTGDGVLHGNKRYRPPETSTHYIQEDQRIKNLPRIWIWEQWENDLKFFHWLASMDLSYVWIILAKVVYLNSPNLLCFHILPWHFPKATLALLFSTSCAFC